MSWDSLRGTLEQEAVWTEASFWVTRLESDEPLLPEELDVWESWIAVPGNHADYDALITTICALQNLARPRLPGDAELRAGLEQERIESRKRGMSLPHTDRAWPIRGSFRLAVAAGLGLAFGLGLILVGRYWQGRTETAPESADVYATVRAEQREFTLPDHSVVTLAGDSHLTFTSTRTTRTAVLDHGEGRFRIHHDPSRPFSVLAGTGVITAVGTVFDVRRYSDHVFVTVSEGVVEVVPGMQELADGSGERPYSIDGVHASRASHMRGAEHATAAARLSDAAHTPAAHARPLRVASGEEIAYDSRGEASVTDHVDAGLAESWIHGSLAYRGCPLREVIEDVQRYSIRPIELDPSIAELQYTGTFVEENLDQWLRGLGQIFPVEVVPDAAERIVIRRREISAEEETDSGH
ncbi:MAG TPA: FecR domain-containing protein [Steroidobacteraceae bacterium]|nr:FecR domain-containing protein [Steroidobacteraceae bacterium]